MKHSPNSSFEKWWRAGWGLNHLTIMHKVKHVLRVLGVFRKLKTARAEYLVYG
jgi:hypothetical protein